MSTPLNSLNSQSKDNNKSFKEMFDLVTEPPTFTGADLYESNCDVLPTLIEPIIPQIGIWAIVGSSDTGKSMLLRQLVLNLSQGKDFLGFKINSKTQKAIYIATEDDHISTSSLLKKQSSNIPELNNIRFYFEAENIPQYLDEQLNAEPADLVVIDCWSDVFGQNLNDSSLIRHSLNQYRTLANKYNCSIGFLHHTGKRTEKLEPSKNNILSGQGFEAKMRLVMELRTDAKDQNVKHLCIVKGNYLGKEYKSSSYVLTFDPDTFLFTNTGERVAFDQLATPVESTQKKKRVQPHEISNDNHLKVLLLVFNGYTQLKLGELNPNLSNQYEKHCNDGFSFGKDRVSKFLAHLLAEKLIIKIGKDKSPNSYYELC